jgi:hypothetical protein
MEQMWASMERLRRDKTAAERTAEAAAADSQRAAVADESLQLLLAALVREGRLEAATTEAGSAEGSLGVASASLADPQRLPQQANSAWSWTATATGSSVVPTDDVSTPPDVVEDERAPQQEERREESGVEASEAPTVELAQSPDGHSGTGLCVRTSNATTPPPPPPPPTWPAEHNDVWAHVQAVVVRQEDLQGQLAFARLEISVLEKIVSKLRGASGN